MIVCVKEDRVVDINLDVAQTRINLEGDKFLRRRASRLVAAKRLYQRDPAVSVCANGVLEQWVAVTLLLVLWLYRVRSKRSRIKAKITGIKVCTAIEVCTSRHSTCGDKAGVCEGTGPPSQIVRFVSHLSEVIRQRLIMSGDVELNPGPLDDVERILSNVDNTTFVEDDWNTVVKECSSLAASWENLGAFLGLSIGTIDSIKESPRISSADGYLQEILKQWIKQNYNIDRHGLPSWRTLLESVARVNTLLFKKLAAKHAACQTPSASASCKANTGMEAPAESTPVTYVYPATSPTGDGQPQLSFPSLNLESMTKKQKEQRHQQLYAESMDMVNKFQHLLSATTRSLKERDISIDDLHCHLVGLGAVPPVYRDLNLPVFQQRSPELIASKKIEQAVGVIGNYCSFFNYHMIEHIINNLGTEQDQKNLSMYREHFNHYAKRLVVECPSEVGTMNNNLATMYVIVDKTYDSYTLESLDIFVNNLRKIFNLSSYAVFELYHIARGSLKLTFQLPYSLLGDIFPLSKEQEVALRRLRVSRLWLMPFDSESLGMGEEEEIGEGDLVTDLKVDDKDDDALSIADSGVGTSSVMTAATVDKEIYFHIWGSQEVRLVVAKTPQFTPRNETEAHYITECTKDSKPNTEQSIPLAVIERVKDNLREVVEEQNNEPSTLGFIFQARFGSVHFILSHQQRPRDVYPIDILTKKPAIFHFGIPFDPQHFIQEQCDEGNVEHQVRYKLKFTVMTSNTKVESKVEERDDGSFKLIWARISTTERSPLTKMAKFDIVRPGRTQHLKRVDVRIVGLPHTLPVDEDSVAHKIAEEITRTMTRRPNGELSVHIVSDKFKVNFIRRKSMRTYPWKEDPNWKIIDCDAHNCTNIESRLWRKKDAPFTVRFRDKPVKEIYFNSATHYTKPTGDPDVRMSTLDEYLSDFKKFLAASFRMAKRLEDTV